MAMFWTCKMPECEAENQMKPTMRWREMEVRCESCGVIHIARKLRNGRVTIAIQGGKDVTESTSVK